MAGPKHLWSGNWDEQSAQAAEERGRRPPPQPDLPAAAEPPAPARSSRWFATRQLAAAVAVLALAGVAVALVTTQGSSPKRETKTHRTTAARAQPTPSQGPSGGVALAPTAPSRVASTPRARWMGMQIVSSPIGTVISTVAAGSAGQSAGFEPGDVITAIGTEAISSPTQIRAVVARIALGNRVQITIDRGSTILTTALTLRNRPTIQP